MVKGNYPPPQTVVVHDNKLRAPPVEGVCEREVMSEGPFGKELRAFELVCTDTIIQRRSSDCVNEKSVRENSDVVIISGTIVEVRATG